VKGDADLSEASPLRGLAAGGRLPELLPLGHGLSLSTWAVGKTMPETMGMVTIAPIKMVTGEW